MSDSDTLNSDTKLREHSRQLNLPDGIPIYTCVQITDIIVILKHIS